MPTKLMSIWLLENQEKLPSELPDWLQFNWHFSVPVFSEVNNGFLYSFKETEVSIHKIKGKSPIQTLLTVHSCLAGRNSFSNQCLCCYCFSLIWFCFSPQDNTRKTTEVRDGYATLTYFYGFSLQALNFPASYTVYRSERTEAELSYLYTATRIALILISTN